MRGLAELDFNLYATLGTHNYLAVNGISTELVAKHSEKDGNQGVVSAVDLINQGKIALVINTPFGRGAARDGRKIRTAAVARGVSCITTLPGLKAAVEGIRELRRGKLMARSIQDWHAS